MRWCGELAFVYIMIYYRLWAAEARAQCVSLAFTLEMAAFKPPITTEKAYFLIQIKGKY